MALAPYTFDTHQNRSAEAGLRSNPVRGEVGETATGEPSFLSLARQADEACKETTLAEYGKQWERNYRAFRSQHPSGSKYTSEAYKMRSKVFRPKTRSMIRRSEAMCAQAFFSNQDVANVTPTDDNNDQARASAAFYQEVLQYRLDASNGPNSIPWFLTAMSAHQTAAVTGVIASMTYWEFAERDSGEKQQIAQIDPETGGIGITEEPIMETVRDRPMLELFPPENVGIDGGASWLDPANSSPYLILRRPMYVVDVKQRMKQNDPKTGQPKWKEHDDTVLMKAMTPSIDSTRQAREGDERRDSKQNHMRAITSFSIVWIHENFIRYDGEDWHYFTIGTEAMLTDPKPVREVYPHAGGERPVRIGYGLLEAFRVMPSGKPELIEGLQQESNEQTNLRIDAGRMALAGRPKVRQGRNINLEQLQRQIPGKPILVREPDDVTWDDPPNVDPSAFAEQDRTNADMDEVAGIFSGSSVTTNRRMNETVGGMRLMANDAMGVGEYDLTVFAKTWVEPTLRDIVALEQRWETDPVVMALAADKAQLIQRYGIDQITDKFLEMRMTVRVNVGVGATDLDTKLQKFLQAHQHATEFLAGVYGPEVTARVLDAEEALNELFALSGYKDAARFAKFDEMPDPAVDALMQAVQQMQQELQSNRAELANKIDVARVQGEYDIAKIEAKERGDILLATISNLQKMRELEMQDAGQRRQLAADQEKTVFGAMTDAAKTGATLQSQERQSERQAQQAQQRSSGND